MAHIIFVTDDVYTVERFGQGGAKLRGRLAFVHIPDVKHNEMKDYLKKQLEPAEISEEQFEYLWSRVGGRLDDISGAFACLLARTC
jgi:hypothetical protein